MYEKKSMKSETSVFENVRHQERAALRNLIGAKATFVNVLGSPGCGKTTLVREAVKNEPCAFIDANLCGSLRGLMSSILRAVASLRPANAVAYDSESDSDVEMKEEQVALGAVPATSTLLDQASTTRRKAAIVANEAIAAGGLLQRMRRHCEQQFIDDSDDEESNSNACKKAVVNRDVYRLLVRAQNLRVKSPSAFLQKLEFSLLRLSNIGIVSPIVVLDNVCDEYEEFLILLSRISELIHSNLRVITISSKLMSLSVSARAVTIAFAPYSKQECIALITTEDQRFSAFVKAAMGFLYPSFCGNFLLLRNTILSIYDRTLFADQKMVAIQSKTQVVSKLQELFGGGDETSFQDQEKELKRIQTEIKWLSLETKQVLVAGYLASHNPVNHDKTIFKSGANNTKKNRTTTTAFKRARLAADCIQIRAPLPFSISRLESIFNFLTSQEEYPILPFIRELVNCGLFKTHNSDPDWLRTDIRINCHAPLDLINLVAKQIGVRLDEVLFA